MLVDKFSAFEAVLLIIFICTGNLYIYSTLERSFVSFICLELYCSIEQ